MKTNYFSERNIAIFILFFMSIQLLFIEGYNISIPKIIMMTITPFFWLKLVPQITKAVTWSLLYFFSAVLILMIQGGITRYSTLFYTLLFLMTFNLYYGLIYVKNVFTIDFFLKILRVIIYSYAICLLLQQICLLVGLCYMPIINLMGRLDGLKSNSLAIEPSQAARVLTITFYCFLSVLEIKNGNSVTLKELISSERKVFVSFIYLMLGMGSGTAIVGLALVSLYFLKSTYVFVIVPTLILVYYISSYIDFTPLNRAVNVVNATLTGDTKEVTRVDNSAACRVNILLNGINNFDLTSSKMWLGQGFGVTNIKDKVSFLGGITEYGFFVYLIKMGLFLTCCFRGLFSLEVLFFFILFSGGIGNVAYCWACLMLLSTTKYFWINRFNINNTKTA